MIRAFSEASDITLLAVISSRIDFSLSREAYKSLSNLEIFSTETSSKNPLAPAYNAHVCLGTVTGSYTPCFRSSSILSPLSSCFLVSSSRSDANWEKAASSLYWARSNFKVQATFFIALIWAEPHTLETESPTSIAGLWPELNKFESRNICPSVIEITFVGI